MINITFSHVRWKIKETRHFFADDNQCDEYVNAARYAGGPGEPE